MWNVQGVGFDRLTERLFRVAAVYRKDGVLPPA
jgi:hypothetical protein